MGSHTLMYDERIMIKILLYLENNFDSIRHSTINEDTYDLNNYYVHAYLQDGVNYIDVYKKFERIPVNRFILTSMKSSKSEEVIEALNRYYKK